MLMLVNNCYSTFGNRFRQHIFKTVVNANSKNPRQFFKALNHYSAGRLFAKASVVKKSVTCNRFGDLEYSPPGPSLTAQSAGPGTVSFHCFPGCPADSGAVEDFTVAYRVLTPCCEMNRLTSV